MSVTKWTWDDDDQRWSVRLKSDSGAEQLEWHGEWYDDRLGSDNSSTTLQPVDDFKRFGAKERNCPAAIEDALIAHFRIVEVPWRRGVAPTVEQLFAASSAGDTGKLLALLASGVDLDARAADDTTALMLAVKGKHEEASRALLDAGADARLVDRSGKTALTWAAIFALPKLIEAIAERERSVLDLVDVEGSHALHYVVGGPALSSAAAALIAAGAKVDAADAKGRTPLMLAARAGATAQVDLLLAAHADTSLVDADARAALHHAVERRERDPLVARLVAAGANVNAQDEYGMTALILCAKGAGSASTVKLLLGAGARVELRGADNYTPLMGAVAATTVSVETLRLLLAAGDDPNAARTGSKSTVLMAAASSSGNVDALRVLLDAGADLRASSSKGQTALHVAIRGGHRDAACFLIERGADPTANDSEGRDAMATVWDNPRRDAMLKALQEAIGRAAAAKARV